MAFNFKTKWDLIKKQIWCRWFHKKHICFHEVWDRSSDGSWRCIKCHPRSELFSNKHQLSIHCPIAGCYNTEILTVKYGYYNGTIHTISLCNKHIDELWEKCKPMVVSQLMHWEHINANK